MIVHQRVREGGIRESKICVCACVSGVARGVHVGSYAPSQYTSAPLKIHFL